MASPAASRPLSEVARALLEAAVDEQNAVGSGKRHYVRAAPAS